MVFGDGTDATEIIENLEQEATALEAEIHDGVPGLNRDQLRLVAALVRRPDAINAILEWSRQLADPLGPLLAAVRSAMQPGSGTTR